VSAPARASVRLSSSAASIFTRRRTDAWSSTVQTAVVALSRARTLHDAGEYRDAVETLERARHSVQGAPLPQHLAFERWRLDRELRGAIDRAREACDAARSVARENGYLVPRCPR
jgi:hypothetical protein